MSENESSVCDALRGVRVVEVGTGITLRYCGRILADLGATVTSLRIDEGSEEEGGHDSLSPALMRWIQRDKLSGEARTAFSDGGVDLVITDRRHLPSIRDEAMAPRSPGTGSARPVIVAVSARGLDSTVDDHGDCELTLQHASGLAFHQADPVSDPEATPPTTSADREAAMAAGVGAAAACLWGLLLPSEQRADTIDAASLDFLSHLLIESVARWNQEPAAHSRKRKPDEAIAIAGGLVWLLPCLDGFVLVSPREQHQWNRWVHAMESPSWASDSSLCGDRLVRMKNAGRLQRCMAEWSSTRTRQEVFSKAHSARIACFPINRPEDLLENEQLASRQFFVRDETSEWGAVSMPGLPFRMKKGDAPNAGHAATACPAPTKRALDGIRVVDFSWVMAGPLATKMLASMGADVIKIESSTRPEFSQRDGWFDILNNGKRSVTVDISAPGGQDLVRKLVMKSHIVVENFSSAVMPKFGLSYEDLRKDRPVLIYLSASGLGRTGPYRDALAYGTLLQGYSGRAGLIGKPNADLEAMGILPAWTDPITAFWELIAALAAVFQLRRSGCGALVDLSMLESTAALLPESLLFAQRAGPAPEGRNSERGAAPAGCFRCRGEDAWIALSVQTDPEWQGLCSALGLTSLWDSPDFRSKPGRLGSKADLDRVVASTVASLDADELERALRAQGVPSSRSRSIHDILTDGRACRPGLFPERSDRRRTIAMPWTDTNGWRGEIGPTPALGADNHDIFCHLLGLTDGQVRILEASGAIR